MDEILTGAGPGAVFGPHVRAWRAAGGQVTAIAGAGFMAYGTAKYGVNVSSGDLDRDGMAEIATGPGPGSDFSAHIRGWNYDGLSVTPLPGVNFMAWPPEEGRYGAGVHAGTDLDGAGGTELIAGAGPDPDRGTRFKVYQYDAGQVSLWFSNSGYGGSFTKGIHVTAGDF
jgi:hypothetical protein